MSNEERSRSKPGLKSTLNFFNNKVSYLNTTRIHVRRSKGLASYLSSAQPYKRDLALLDTSLGIMSFSLYMLRFSANIGLLIQLVLIESQEKINPKIRKDLYYSLLNDCMWSLVNLTQFCWLSYSKSASDGLHGMQLETLVQLIDILVLIIRYQQDQEEYNLKYQNATATERAHLDIEWQHKQLNMLRSLYFSLSMMITFGVFSFVTSAIPFSPILSLIVLSSSLLRVLIDMEKDKQLIEQLKLNGADSQQIISEEAAMTGARLNDLNQITLNNVFLPMGLFLLITTPILLTVAASLSMLLIHFMLTQLINTTYSPLKPMMSDFNGTTNKTQSSV